MGIAYFDITPISREAISKPEYLASDQLHPSAEMYSKWVDLLVSNSAFNFITSSFSKSGKNHQFPVFPNPASTFVHFYFTDIHGTLEIFNYLGKKIYQFEIQNQKQLNIKVSNWQSGMYFYRIQHKSGDAVKGTFQVK